MKQKAITEATVRLERARAALAEMEKERFHLDTTKFDSAWWAFLLAANNVYSKLEQGAKGNGNSATWFGQMKHIRRKDELLQYLHQARNSDEHSLEHSTHQTDIGIEPRGRAKLVPAPDGSDKPHIQIPSDAKPGEVIAQVIPPYVQLRPVKDNRFGNTFYSPKVHLGQPVADPSPIGVAHLAIAYLETLIDEASKLAE